MRTSIIARCCCVCILAAVLLSGCGRAEHKPVKIQVSGMQDILSWEGGVVWNTREDIFLKRESGSGEGSIFQDPFYEREEGEEILLQYVEENRLYYIRIFENRYFELCEMNLSNYENTILYTNASRQERTYHYLGRKEDTALTPDERMDARDRLVERFCVIGDDLYLFMDSSLYQMNRWTKYKKLIVGDVESDTELVFWDSKIYFKNTGRQLMEYDRDSGTVTRLSDWMAEKICFGGGGLLVQRMNGELYRFKDPGLEKILDEPVQLLQADDKYFYCVEENGGKIVVYDAASGQKRTAIACNNIWGVAPAVQDKVYYLDLENEEPVLRETDL